MLGKRIPAWALFLRLQHFYFSLFFTLEKKPGFTVLGNQHPVNLFAQLVLGNEAGYGFTCFHQKRRKIKHLNFAIRRFVVVPTGFKSVTPSM